MTNLSPQSSSGIVSSVTENNSSTRTSHELDRPSSRRGHPIALAIIKALVPNSEQSPVAFLPQDKLREILGPSVIQNLLNEAYTKDKSKTLISPAQIVGTESNLGRYKILAALLLIHKIKYISHFVYSNVWDVDLPISGAHRIFENHKWTDLAIDGFLAKQYLFLPYIIDFDCMQHVKLNSNIRMPFLDLLDGKKRGAHGQVSKVRIHKQYQKWGQRTRCHDRYAVKRFTADDAAFDQERAALARFSHPNPGHENLIQLLFSYELQSVRYLVFPCAEGDLEDYWKDHGCDPSSPQQLTWMIQQCHGLASGLAKVHNHFSWPRHSRYHKSQNQGRHGDIKPKNILFFDDITDSHGRLVVADFTLMRFHSPNTDYTRIKDVNYSQTYRPPEKAAQDDSQVSQKYDIWTLGCVFLEFITWHLLGFNAVRSREPTNENERERGFQAPDGQEREDFYTSRQQDDDNPHKFPDDKFWNSTNGTGIVKHSVMKWIRFLRSLEHSSQALHDFLDFITHSMLVVRPKDRCSMMHVASRLARIAATCKADPVYCEPLNLKTRAEYMVPDFPRLLGARDEYGRVRVDPNPLIHAAIDPLSQEDYSLFEREFGVKENDNTQEVAYKAFLPPEDRSSLGEIPKIRSDSLAVSNVPTLSRDESRLSGLLTQSTTRQTSEDGRPSHDGMTKEIVGEGKPTRGFKARIISE
ncbi:kinase-like protein [Fusarium austroafricanum]|uniref:Kinase-like protein n=1 Tax=Fusarium austroafricanum TaxID=2364996 RepID=A0A8H4KFT6_9HYPO|nr:kinase-like protein [Fusarium austroafricanum]